MRLRAVLLVGALAMGCGSDGAPESGGSPSPSPAHEEDFCGHVGEIQALIEPMSEQTITGEELFAELDEIHSNLEADLAIIEEEGSARARVAEDVTDAIGQLKVTVDAAGSNYFGDIAVTDALMELSFALDAIGFC